MTSRCDYCHKKIKGLISIPCDCQKKFCMKHMNKHSHECQTLLKTNITKLPKVISDKVVKI